MLIQVGILCIVQLLINVREEEFPAPNHWEVFLQLMVMQQICASLSVISLLCGPQPETFITVESAIYFCIARMAINGIEIEIVCTSGGCAGIPIHRGGGRCPIGTIISDTGKRPVVIPSQSRKIEIFIDVRWTTGRNLVVSIITGFIFRRIIRAHSDSLRNCDKLWRGMPVCCTNDRH